jgi:hypothetical protein
MHDRMQVRAHAHPHTHGPQDDACPICGYWTCRCSRTAVSR